MSLIECPKCRGTDFHYDSYEDMYTCKTCFKSGANWYIFEPEEVGVEDNPNAGHRTMYRKD